MAAYLTNSRIQITLGMIITGFSGKTYKLAADLSHRVKGALMRDKIK